MSLFRIEKGGKAYLFRRSGNFKCLHCLKLRTTVILEVDALRGNGKDLCKACSLTHYREEWPFMTSAAVVDLWNAVRAWEVVQALSIFHLPSPDARRRGSVSSLVGGAK